MFKQISIILACIASSLIITGCGIKGPLYQTPSENIAPSSAEQSHLNISTSKR
jgi:predicted small lipoprotein YifL